jgi:hypothetical protein
MSIANEQQATAAYFEVQRAWNGHGGINIGDALTKLRQALPHFKCGSPLRRKVESLQLDIIYNAADPVSPSFDNGPTQITLPL